jgi:ParB-like chromosome segregation protein Spo0J
MLMKSISIAIERIYVPIQLRRSIDQDKVHRIAEQILNEGQKTPIQVRRDGDRYVLVTGVHRLEAMRALGETVIEALIVRARLR